MRSKILIADDDTLVRGAIQKILTLFNYEVVAVESGKQVLECVSDVFDVIVLDINMPDMDGFETLERLNQRRVDIPVLFLTGAGCMDYAVKAINLGAYDFLTKPIVDIELFNAKIKQAVEKRHYLLQEKNYKKQLEREVAEKTHELAEKNLRHIVVVMLPGMDDYFFQLSMEVVPDGPADGRCFDDLGPGPDDGEDSDHRNEK